MQRNDPKSIIRVVEGCEVFGFNRPEYDSFGGDVLRYSSYLDSYHKKCLEDISYFKEGYGNVADNPLFFFKTNRMFFPVVESFENEQRDMCKFLKFFRLMIVDSAGVDKYVKFNLDGSFYLEDLDRESHLDVKARMSRRITELGEKYLSMYEKAKKEQFKLPYKTARKNSEYLGVSLKSIHFGYYKHKLDGFYYRRSRAITELDYIKNFDLLKLCSFYQFSSVSEMLMVPIKYMSKNTILFNHSSLKFPKCSIELAQFIENEVYSPCSFVTQVDYERQWNVDPLKPYKLLGLSRVDIIATCYGLSIFELFNNNFCFDSRLCVCYPGIERSDGMKDTATELYLKFNRLLKVLGETHIDEKLGKFYI